MKEVKPGTPDSELVTLCGFSDPTQAELVRNMLVDHGLKAEIGGIHQGGFTGTLPVELIVRKVDVEKAIEFIQVHFPDVDAQGS